MKLWIAYGAASLALCAAIVLVALQPDKTQPATVPTTRIEIDGCVVSKVVHDGVTIYASGNCRIEVRP